MQPGRDDAAFAGPGVENGDGSRTEPLPWAAIGYADFVPVFRYFLSSGWQRCICALIEFIRYLFEDSIYALRFDGREGHPIYSRSPIVLFSQRICSA